jgi:hypothetical protein
MHLKLRRQQWTVPGSFLMEKKNPKRTVSPRLAHAVRLLVKTRVTSLVPL